MPAKRPANQEKHYFPVLTTRAGEPQLVHQLLQSQKAEDCWRILVSIALMITIMQSSYVGEQTHFFCSKSWQSTTKSPGRTFAIYPTRAHLSISRNKVIWRMCWLCPDGLIVVWWNCSLIGCLDCDLNSSGKLVVPPEQQKGDAPALQWDFCRVYPNQVSSQKLKNC